MKLLNRFFFSNYAQYIDFDNQSSSVKSEGWFREMWYTFVKPIVIPKFEQSDFDISIHIIDNNTRNFLL